MIRRPRKTLAAMSAIRRRESILSSRCAVCAVNPEQPDSLTVDLKRIAVDHRCAAGQVAGVPATPPTGKAQQGGDTQVASLLAISDSPP